MPASGLCLGRPGRRAPAPRHSRPHDQFGSLGAQRHAAAQSRLLAASVQLAVTAFKAAPDRAESSAAGRLGPGRYHHLVGEEVQPGPSVSGQDGMEVHLPGSVGGAMRIGDTVHRPTGPWTEAVHALLGYLDNRVPSVPRVLGYDEQGREVLSYLPGRVLDGDSETLSIGQVVSLVGWTRAFHDVVAGFTHAGPWRFFPVADPSLIGHNDIAPYNVCFEGDEVVGVFDWDLAGPTTPLLELAFIAWNCVPLWRDTGPGAAAERLRVIAAAYGGLDARQILYAVPQRIQAMLDWIPAAAAAGDQGMAHIMTLGEPGLSQRALAGLAQRIPAIDWQLG